MRTTLNIPDSLVATAKRRALDESTTLTDLIVQGLSIRLEKKVLAVSQPISTASGGLVAGASWDFHELGDATSQWYR